MEKPTIDVRAHQKEFRLTLLNTKKSAIAGGLLLLLPFLFLSGVVLRHYMGVNVGIFTSVYEWIGAHDRAYGDSSVLNWVIRILLILGPLAAIAVNLLAILHMRYEKMQKEIVMSLKLKWVNLMVILVCSLIFLVFALYLFAENMGPVSPDIQ